MTDDEFYLRNAFRRHPNVGLKAAMFFAGIYRQKQGPWAEGELLRTPGCGRKHLNMFKAYFAQERRDGWYFRPLEEIKTMIISPPEPEPEVRYTRKEINFLHKVKKLRTLCDEIEQLIDEGE